MVEKAINQALLTEVIPFTEKFDDFLKLSLFINKTTWNCDFIFKTIFVNGLVNAVASEASGSWNVYLFYNDESCLLLTNLSIELFQLKVAKKLSWQRWI